MIRKTGFPLFWIMLQAPTSDTGRGRFMRRDRVLGRGRWLPLLLAGFVGYLIGDWHAVASRAAALSASQNVALRFPQPAAEPAVTGSIPATADEAPASTTMVLGDRDLALLNPERMVPERMVPARSAPPQAAPASVSAAAVKSIVGEDAAPVPQPRPLAAPPRAKLEPKGENKAEITAGIKAQIKAEAKQAVAAARSDRAGFLLNNAQIVSIRERLHLSADQERMWPAVEAALRNIAYAHARDPHHRDVAALDPDSAEVQGLKSAAVPLLMSFDDDQKTEVRNLAHVMGLDQLASEF
jgi:hypothetical protein